MKGEQMTKNNSKNSEKYMLTLTEAREYFGIGDRKLRLMSIENKEIFRHNGKKILVIRERMEEYLQKCEGCI